MCSIFGVIANSNIEDQKELLVESHLLMNRRGPDASGEYLQNNIFLAHNRLSIIDLDPRSNQPMHKEDISIVFNGEIYNFIELRKELGADRFDTMSDTEVLIVGYKTWGIEKLLSKIEGMFAFAILDKGRDKIFFARDRMGKKPLFFYRKDKTIVFSSEVAPIKNYIGRFELNPEGLDAYLILNYSPPKDHLVENLESLKPGHYAICDLNDLTLQELSYWNIFQDIDKRTTIADTEQLEQQIIDSIDRRLIADVPVCGFLSGGIDSSLIAAIAQERVDYQFRTYCIGYEGYDKFNEFEYADAVAKRYKLDHQEVMVSVEDSKKLLFKYCDLLDEPISNWVWVPLFFLSEQVRNDGHKVVVVGEGADELFYGYNSFAKNLKALDRGVSQTDKLLSRMTTPLTNKLSNGHRTFDKWFRANHDLPIYMGTSFNLTATQRERFAGDRLKDQSKDPLSGYKEILNIQENLKKESSGNYDNVDMICYTEIYSKMIEVLVRRVDRITMLNSIEARAPFLDQKLINFVFQTMGQNRINGNIKKAWLKEVARKYIPNECIDRKKMGFSFPFKQWINGDLGVEIHDYFLEANIFKDGWLNRDFVLNQLSQHRAGKRDNSPKIWSLFTLAKWYDNQIAK